MEHPTKLLFICSQNHWRSPTAEKLYQGFPGYLAKSAGTEAGARIRVTEGLIGWADIIFVMEKKHGEILRQKFSEAMSGKKVICLHVPDDYSYMSPELIDLLKTNLSGHVEVPD